MNNAPLQAGRCPGRGPPVPSQQKPAVRSWGSGARTGPSRALPKHCSVWVWGAKLLNSFFWGVFHPVWLCGCCYPCTLLQGGRERGAGEERRAARSGTRSAPCGELRGEGITASTHKG